mmetsp:Transcript_8939/g.26628  ORF Transcript_8939/g.26628 Transcript_8939/m.26628 type:complete len:240 (+) Transcript_8939:89-808(+)
MIRNQSSLSRPLGRQRQRRRSEEKKSCTPATLPSMNGVTILLLLVALCACATRCSSFQMGGPILRVQRPAGCVGNPLLHRASVAVLAISESQEGGDQDNDDERVSDDHCDDDGDEAANGSPSSSQSSEEKQSVHPPLTNLAFDDVAESPAPPLNYQKYLTMQVGSFVAFPFVSFRCIALRGRCCCCCCWVACLLFWLLLCSVVLGLPMIITIIIFWNESTTARARAPNRPACIRSSTWF